MVCLVLMFFFFSISCSLARAQEEYEVVDMRGCSSSLCISETDLYEKLKNIFGIDNIFIGDTYYEKMDIEIVKSELADFYFRQSVYLKNKNDCDKAVDFFRVNILKKYLPQTKFTDSSIPVGIMWFRYLDGENQRDHAVNIFVSSLGSVYILEPQTNIFYSFDVFKTKYNIVKYFFVKI
jgi:hypothetical protein